MMRAHLTIILLVTFLGSQGGALATCTDLPDNDVLDILCENKALLIGQNGTSGDDCIIGTGNVRVLIEKCFTSPA